MPYEWTRSNKTQTCQIWPHNTLSPRGFAVMICLFFSFTTLPLLAVLGSQAYWGLLPFSMGGVAIIWIALRRNGRDRDILEVLEIDANTTRLGRQQSRQPDRAWESPTYWVRLTLHATSGPVPNYITLKNQDREVEIGAFLSEEERIALHRDLDAVLSRYT